MNTIAIVSVVDVVAALAAETLAGSVYLMDNNKANGSTDEGSEVLRTKVKKGDHLVWICMPLECEAFLSITGVVIDKKYKDYCEPAKQTYPGTNVVFWHAEVKKELDVTIPYHLKFALGSRRGDMAMTTLPALIGSEEAPKAAASPKPAPAATKQ